MKQQRFVIWLWLTLFVLTDAAGVELQNLTRLTERNGLTQNTIRCIMQDRRGFLWLGTINGLNRYNGKDITAIYPHITGKQTLPDGRIREIIEDHNGLIWIRTFSNTLFCYNPEQEQTVDYAPMDKDKEFSRVEIFSNGDVWVWGAKGCLQVRSVAGRLEAWKPDVYELAEENILFVYEQEPETAWIGTENGLFRIEKNNVKKMRTNGPFLAALKVGDLLLFAGRQGMYVYDIHAATFNLYETTLDTHSAHMTLLAKNVVLLTTDNKPFMFDATAREWMETRHAFGERNMNGAQFIKDNKGNVWVYNMTGVLWRHRGDNTFEPLQLIPREVLSLITQERYAVYHDSHDIIWITTFGNGLFAIDNRSGQTKHYSIENDLPTNYLFCVTEDRSGEIWVGTELAGAVKITPSVYPFELYTPAPDKKMERANAVRLIYEDSEGTYWLGTRDGHLYVYDKNMRRRYEHRIDGGLPFTIAEDTLGRKWLGTKGNGLYILSPQGERIEAKYTLPDRVGQSSSSNNIFTILRDNKNRMWLATFGGGLYLAERGAKGLAFRKFSFGDSHWDMTRSMIQSHNGNIWVGTNNGIAIFNPDELETDTTRFNILHIGEKQTLTHNEVKVIYEDSRNNVWAGTTGGGLYMLEAGAKEVSDSFKHFGKEQGLSNEMVQAIQEDKNGNIWVSTESSISRFNPEEERFENFIFSNKRYPTVFNELSCWRKQDGKLMFGSYDGIYVFNPDSIHTDEYAPQVLLTGLWVNGTYMTPEMPDSPLQTSIVCTRKLVLKSFQNSFNLEYAMPNYRASELNQYTYYLEGYEKGWNNRSGNNLATYRNVPPGHYVFKVKGCNSSGKWSGQDTELTLIILPPWWATWQAIVAYAILGTVCLTLAIRLARKMHRLHTEVIVEKQLTEYKLRFFTNISHEFRTPLTIIRGTIEDLAGSKEIAPLISTQLRLLSKSSARLMRLIDQLLEFRRLQNGKTTLNLEHVQARTFFKDIYQTFSEIADRKHIDYKFEADFPERTLLLDKDKLDKIAYNLLSNAFKHTPDGGKIEMKLKIEENKDKFIVSVSDSGPGIPPDKRKTLFIRFAQARYHAGGIGIGLHLVAELTKIHQGNAEYHDSEWGGACFTITLPLSDKNYDATNVVEADASDSKEQKREELVLLTDNAEKPIQEPVYGDYRLLVIEDDDDVRELITKQLSNHFTVSEASNGAEGLQKVAQDAPDLIVCDLMMPQMDGLTFTKKLKSDFNTSHIPVILLTAYSSEEYRLKGIQAGADSYITKPFSVNYLLARVVKLIEQREKLKRKFASEPGTKQPPTIAMTDPDKVFLDKIHALIEKNLGNADFKLETYATDFNIGRTTFFNKLKNLAGYSPNEYVRVIRMKKAAELLLTTEYNISEVGYQVGMNDPLYFSKCFKNTFGKSPSLYRKDKGRQT